MNKNMKQRARILSLSGGLPKNPAAITRSLAETPR